MLKEISESEFLKITSTPIRQIEISELDWIMDDDLIVCKGVVVSFGDDKILIQSKETYEDMYNFVYYEYSPLEGKLFSQKIISTDAEQIQFIDFDNDPYPSLRFQVGIRPMCISIDDDFLTVGLSCWGKDGSFVEYDNHVLFNA